VKEMERFDGFHYWTCRPRRAVPIGMISFCLLLFLGWISRVQFEARRGDTSCQANSGIQMMNNIERPAMQAILDRYSQAHQGVGLQATVIYPDGSIWTGVSGYANLEKKCLLTPQHLLGLGSISKLFTATLVLDQVEKGSLSLDTDAETWFPWLHRQSVTVRMLLNHTSGIPNYTAKPAYLFRALAFPGKDWEPEELANLVESQSLLFLPGSRHEYSNSNYILLGLILEEITGSAYPDLLDEILLNPLELEDTYAIQSPATCAMANAYDESLLHLGRRNVTGFRRSLMSSAYSAGGLMSTSSDVAFMVKNLFEGHLISQALVEQMTRLVSAADEHVPSQVGYGLGVRSLEISSETWVGHTGSIPGYSGIAMYNPERDLTIVILANRSIVAQEQLLDELLTASALSSTPTPLH